MKKAEAFMNKPAYLGLSMLDISKTVVQKFWYDSVRPKYDENAKLCYMDTDDFIVYEKIENIYVDIAKNVETGFNGSNYELDRPRYLKRKILK